jgi:hypothetical protein
MTTPGSAQDLWTSIPNVFKVAFGALMSIVALWAVAFGVGQAYAEAATKTDVRTETVKVSKAAKLAIKKVADDVRELQEVDAAHAAERQREQHAKAAELKQWKAVFKHLVSIQAADGEENKNRKADASRFAKTAYQAALNAGAEPADAAEQALDTPPPWRLSHRR